MNKEWHEWLTKDFKEEELWKIIKDSPTNKSPGTEGFTTEFYQAFWPYIKTYMMDSFKESLDNGQLTTTPKRGIISLIPKPQKDLDMLKNWRPITLLNQDYKYLAKIVANRLKAILPEIISTDQSGFVSNRFIGSNIIRIQTLIEMCKERRNPCQH